MKSKVKNIRLLLMDIDGVLTDGRIIMSDLGDELKFFDVHDGLGLMFWHRAGYKSAIITAGESPLVLRRASLLNIDKVYQKANDKLAVYNKIKKIYKASDKEICFIGDDLIDIPVLRRVGFSCCVPNAIQEVKKQVDYMTKKPGGRGAIREVIDLILKQQNLWKKVTSAYRI